MFGQKNETKYKRDFRDDVKIDRFSLEKEAAKLPSLYLYWSEILSETRENRDKLKIKYEAERGNRYLNLKEDEINNGKKPTEAWLASVLDQNKELMSIREEINSLSKEIGIIGAAVTALEIKKSQIENLRYLYLSGYYSAPETKKSKTDEILNEMRNELNTKQGGHHA